MRATHCDVTEALLEETLVDGPKNKAVDGVSLTCSVCDQCADCPGYDTPENRRLLVEKLNRSCPEHRVHKFKILVD